MARLAGVFPVLPTPFDAAGSVDRDAFVRLIDFAVQADVDGVVFPGMASEVETLSPEERADLIALLGRHLAGRLPFIVGASDADPARAATRAEEGRAAGAVAAMIMAPNRCGQDIAAQIAFYGAVATATALPIMLQNAPAPMGAGLPDAAVIEIVKQVPAIRFVKEETIPCGQHVTALLAGAGDRLDGVFGGAGARYVMDELARGASGTMPALELADLHAALFKAHERGEKAEARRLYSRTLPLLLFQQTFRIHATKHVLRARGLLEHVTARAGGAKPDAHDEAECAALIAEAADLFWLHPVRKDHAA
jgi:4-hydroxy-tetrahydrodipicolinate synthase